MTFRSNSLVIVCIVTLVLGKLQKVFAEKAPLDPENNQHQEMMEDSVALGNPFNYTSLHDTFVHFMAFFFIIASLIDELYLLKKIKKKS